MLAGDFFWRILTTIRYVSRSEATPEIPTFLKYLVKVGPDKLKTRSLGKGSKAERARLIREAMLEAEYQSDRIYDDVAVKRPEPEKSGNESDDESSLVTREPSVLARKEEDRLPRHNPDFKYGDQVNRDRRAAIESAMKTQLQAELIVAAFEMEKDAFAGTFGAQSIETNDTEHPFFPVRTLIDPLTPEQRTSIADEWTVFQFAVEEAGFGERAITDYLKDLTDAGMLDPRIKLESDSDDAAHLELEPEEGSGPSKNDGGRGNTVERSNDLRRLHRAKTVAFMQRRQSVLSADRSAAGHGGKDVSDMGSYQTRLAPLPEEGSGSRVQHQARVGGIFEDTEGSDDGGTGSESHSPKFGSRGMFADPLVRTEAGGTRGTLSRETSPTNSALSRNFASLRLENAPTAWKKTASDKQK